MKINIKSIKAAHKEIWMVKVLPRNTERTCSTRHCKI